MGLDSAPFVANLLLYYFGNKWIFNSRKSNLHKAYSFANKFCFIDNLCAINDNVLFEKHFKEINLKK